MTKSNSWNSQLSFRVKICGVSTLSDVQAVVDSQSDAIGLNFYSGSRRFVSIETAAKLVTSIPVHVRRVGVFVNADADSVKRAVEAASLDLVQLHGDEPPEFALALGNLPYLRAFRVGTDGLRPVAEFLKTCRDLGKPPVAALIDASVRGEYGGTGKKVDWQLIAEQRSLLGHIPLVLAGGLTPENVSQAVAATCSNAVDTAGGVENSERRKDPKRVAGFAKAAQLALKTVNSNQQSK